MARGETTKMREAEERRRTEWEAAMKMKEDMRRKRRQEDEERRARIEQEQMLEEAKRKEERMRWEAREAEKQARDRLRWEKRWHAWRENENVWKIWIETIENVKKQRRGVRRENIKSERKQQEESCPRCELISRRNRLQWRNEFSTSLRNSKNVRSRRRLRAEKEEEARRLAAERETEIREEIQMQQEKLKQERERMEKEWSRDMFHKGEAVEVAYDGV